MLSEFPPNFWEHAFTHYLTRASWAPSSQGMQDHPGAKSANWLCSYICMYVAELSTSSSNLSDCCTTSKPVGFLCAAAQLCKIGWISVMSRRSLSVSNEWIASNLWCIEMGNLRNLMKLLWVKTSAVDRIGLIRFSDLNACYSVNVKTCHMENILANVLKQELFFETMERERQELGLGNTNGRLALYLMKWTVTWRVNHRYTRLKSDEFIYFKCMSPKRQKQKIIH